MKVYDIMITEGEFKGYFRQTGITSRELAEDLKSEYWDESDAIVEREEPDTVRFEDLF